jgi:hypothetical protein
MFKLLFEIALAYLIFYPMPANLDYKIPQAGQELSSQRLHQPSALALF